MRGFLLDAHLPLAVVGGVLAARPNCRIEHIARWREGAFREAADERILAAALDVRLMLVTYDVGTVPAVMHRWLGEGRPSPEVALVRSRAIAQNDVGGIVRALVTLYDDPAPLDPGYPIVYLGVVSEGADKDT